MTGLWALLLILQFRAEPPQLFFGGFSHDGDRTLSVVIRNTGTEARVLRLLEAPKNLEIEGPLGSRIPPGGAITLKVTLHLRQVADALEYFQEQARKRREEALRSLSLRSPKEQAFANALRKELQEIPMRAFPVTGQIAFEVLDLFGNRRGVFRLPIGFVVGPPGALRDLKPPKVLAPEEVER